MAANDIHKVLQRFLWCSFRLLHPHSCIHPRCSFLGPDQHSSNQKCPPWSRLPQSKHSPGLHKLLLGHLHNSLCLLSPIQCHIRCHILGLIGEWYRHRSPHACRLPKQAPMSNNHHLHAQHRLLGMLRHSPVHHLLGILPHLRKHRLLELRQHRNYPLLGILHHSRKHRPLELRQHRNYPPTWCLL